jgi:hypothetical protein
MATAWESALPRRIRLLRGSRTYTPIPQPSPLVGEGGEPVGEPGEGSPTTNRPIMRHPKLLAVFPMLLLAGCASAGGYASIDSSAWTPQTPPAEVAAAVERACRGITVNRTACYERGLTAAIEPAGVGVAARALDLLVASTPALVADAHGIAHGLGINAYRSPETLAETFSACPPTQMSGCYHGVIQGYFLAVQREGRTADAALLDGVCAPHRPNNALYFQCAHGLGHGVMALTGSDLRAALNTCDLATDAFVRENCYGGVFMENIVSVTHPHHTADAHAGHGAPAGGAQDDADAHAHHAAPAADPHAGHGEHAHHAAEPPLAPLDRSDPLHPCTAVDARYHRQCYLNQTSAILYFNRGDVNAAARTCARAPAGMVDVCLESLGRDVVALAARHPGRTASLCTGTGSAAGPCLRGAAQTLTNMDADPQAGFRFCASVPEEHREGCYGAVAGMLYAIEPEPARRAATCAALDAPFAAVCRANAGLPVSD